MCETGSAGGRVKPEYWHEHAAQEQYFTNIHTQSLERQLDGTYKNLELKHHQENSVSREYVFPERARIANVLFFSSEPLTRRRDHPFPRKKPYLPSPHPPTLSRPVLPFSF